MKNQLGGTVVGFLAGLLVGLGLALAVAVYVTKVPVPFVDRGVSRKPTQDAIEAEKNRNWNPNAGLAGAKPAAPKADTPPPEEGAVKAEGTAPAPKPAAPAPSAPTPAAASSDPLGDLARSRAQGSAPAPAPVAAAPATSGAESDAFMYFVQAGAFRTTADAEAQRAKLAMLGFDAKVSEREQAGQTVYRVRTGPHRVKSDADATQAKLASNGIDAALVRVQR